MVVTSTEGKLIWSLEEIKPSYKEEIIHVLLNKKQCIHIHVIRWKPLLYLCYHHTELGRYLLQWERETFLFTP